MAYNFGGSIPSNQISHYDMRTICIKLKKDPIEMKERKFAFLLTSISKKKNYEIKRKSIPNPQYPSADGGVQLYDERLLKEPQVVNF